MGLKRAGMVLFSLGLLLASVAAVAGGTACTEMHCPGHEPQFAVVGVDATTGAILYTDGCNTCRTSGLVGVGLGLLGAGVVVGGAGVLQSVRRAP